MRLLTVLILLVGAPPAVRVAPAQSPAERDGASLAAIASNQTPEVARWPNYARLFAAQTAEKHPAVARIIVPEQGAVAYGTGTLIDVREQYGLVITNWHVVRDATGTVEVVFPSGFRSQARALKVDPDWDLAALVIWRPPVEPVELASMAPRAGDSLTIHGYGQGDYRVATGRCTQYYAPRVDFPQEMVELDVEARQGDSGGPIFNAEGELAGVLFGAGQGTTIGSFNGRVGSFLATLAPDIGRGTDGVLVAANHPQEKSPPADLSAAGGKQTASATTSDTEAHDPFAPPCPHVACSPRRHPWPDARCCAPPSIPHTVVQRELPADVDDDSPWPSTPWRAASNSQSDLAPEQDATATAPAASQSATAHNAKLLGQLKSILAVVGLFAICIQLVRAVS